MLDPHPITCPQLVGKGGARGHPGSPNSSSPRTTTSEDLGVDGVSPRIALQGDRSQVPSRPPPTQLRLKTKVSGALARLLNDESSGLPMCISCSKNHRIPSSTTRSGKLQRRPTTFHMHVLCRWRQTALDMYLLMEGPGFPKRE
jgi:hypothetical protein